MSEKPRLIHVGFKAEVDLVEWIEAEARKMGLMHRSAYWRHLAQMARTAKASAERAA